MFPFRSVSFHVLLVSMLRIHNIYCIHYLFRSSFWFSPSSAGDCAIYNEFHMIYAHLFHFFSFLHFNILHEYWMSETVMAIGTATATMYDNNATMLSKHSELCTLYTTTPFGSTQLLANSCNFHLTKISLRWNWFKCEYMQCMHVFVCAYLENWKRSSQIHVHSHRIFNCSIMIFIQWSSYKLKCIKTHKNNKKNTKMMATTTKSQTSNSKADELKKIGKSQIQSLNADSKGRQEERRTAQLCVYEGWVDKVWMPSRENKNSPRREWDRTLWK